MPPEIAQELQVQPTINPAVLAANTQAQDLSENLPPGCVLHEIQAGDTPFGIAEQYGANGFNIMLANGLTEETAASLQIGQVLIIPLGDCPLQNFTLTPTPTNRANCYCDLNASCHRCCSTTTSIPTAKPTATLSLAPTATNAQVEIVRILKPGDITQEAVEIQNRGEAVNLLGWTLTDAEGNVFEFREQLLFTDGIVTVYTRDGQNTHRFVLGAQWCCVECRNGCQLPEKCQRGGSIYRSYCRSLSVATGLTTWTNCIYPQ
ncbi:MAG UNVERIFIED_CONTAM: LysM peptidoglycan-binding domain-containing protein [Anaerolineae bacterium]